VVFDDAPKPQQVIFLRGWVMAGLFI